MEKIYCGSAKIITTKFGEIITASLNFDALEQAVVDYGFRKKSGEQVVKIKILERKNPDNFGNTHTVLVDTFKPDFKDEKIPF
jgi:hypothetical protein